MQKTAITTFFDSALERWPDHEHRGSFGKQTGSPSPEKFRSPRALRVEMEPRHSSSG